MALSSTFPSPVQPQRLGARLRTAWRPRCAFCALDAGDPVCDACREDFLPTVMRCTRCAIRLPQGMAETICGRCLRESPAYDATVTAGDYRAPLDAMVIALKFGHRLELARALGRLLAAQLGPPPSTALLVPVPLAFERHAQRGFNQSLEIARELARTTGALLARDVLQRVRHCAPQEGLTADARRRNVRGVFSVTSHARSRLDGACVWIVDDVMTSGSTLNEAARVLKAAGAAHVMNAVVARTP